MATTQTQTLNEINTMVNDMGANIANLVHEMNLIMKMLVVMMMKMLVFFMVKIGGHTIAVRTMVTTQRLSLRYLLLMVHMMLIHI